MTRKQLLALAIVAAGVAAWFAFDLGDLLTFANAVAARAEIVALYQANPVTVALSYFGVYVMLTALSFPGAAVMTVLAGAVFGLATGTILVSFASTLGSVLAMLLARYLFRDAVRKRFTNVIARVDDGVSREGAFYLFALRLVPVFPFFAVNLAMALTSIRTWTYAWVSQLGMFPATVVFVNAGTELAALSSLEGILAPGFILSFTALGLLPLVSRKILGRVRAARIQRGFDKPKVFDRNLVVIGAGAAGLVSAYIAAAVKARVTLIEKQAMGGDCLNTGCVPSKALLRAADIVHTVKDAGRYGIRTTAPEVDFPAVMARVKEVIRAIEPHDSVERYVGLGVECISGEARIVSPWKVTVNGQELTTRSIIVATGARPAVPPIPGLSEAEFLTSDTVWNLDSLPGRLVVLGGGPIGCELAQAFARLGSDVAVIEMAPRVLAREEPDAAELVATALRRDGVTLHLGARASAVEGGAAGGVVHIETADGATQVPYDRLLVAVGRQPRLTGFGLEELGIATDTGTVETDAYLQTLHPNIYACGDVAGPFQFTHTAAHQAWYASVNALFGRFKRFRADYSVIPRVTYTHPEVASVGYSQASASEGGVDYEVTDYGLDDLDRAIVEGQTEGFVRVLTVPGKDRILGATVVGEHAGELLAELTFAMRQGVGLKKILGTVHAYPTRMEANKFAAGNWSRAHVPAWALNLLERYHSWERGAG
ncbi:MAG: FAD-dependent oxidoreductase [Pseudomonadota bacterium]